MTGAYPISCRQGFSLVELSIMLVILGLLTGGILGGQSLIKAAEMRSISTEFNSHQTAVNIFKQKYSYLPGDMTNATSFWGRADNGSFSGQCSDPDDDEGTGTETCNGDGNGKIGIWGDAAYYEVFRFWQHLVNAGLISGTYTGISGSASSAHVVFGENTPASKFSSGGWGVENAQDYIGDSTLYALEYDNYYEFGSQTASSCNEGELLTPEETWNLDTKMDDGKPGTGSIVAGHWDECTLSASKTDLDEDYDLTNDTRACIALFRHAH